MFVVQVSSDCNGCAGGGTDGGVDCHDLGINIYACRGEFSGGMEDSTTESICNQDQGYHICSDASEAASFGLTNTLCNSLPSNEVYFTQETSAGGGDCYTDHPSSGNKEDGPRNDVWGCGGTSYCQTTSCYSTLTMFCTSGDGQSGPDFYLGTDGYYEYDNIQITDRSRGGVLCCQSGQERLKKCTANGDPHFVQWDFSRHHFQGESYYDYITKCNEDDLFPFIITAKQEECGRYAPMTCINEIRVTLGDSYDNNDGIIVFPKNANNDPTWLSSGDSAVGNDQSFSHGNFSVSRGSFSGTFIDPDLGDAEITISFIYSGWNFESTISNDSAINLENRICGVCGNLNGNSSDDFETRDGTVLSNDGSEIFPMSTNVWENTFEFGDSWCNEDFSNECVPTVVPTQPPTECLDSIALDYCETIWNNYCTDSCGNSDDTSNTIIDYDNWLDDCIFDSCLASGEELVNYDYHDAIKNKFFESSISECAVFCNTTTTNICDDESQFITCTASGDPHITQWDFSKHHFQGEAYYDYITKCNEYDLFPFTISIKQEECGQWAPMTCISEVRVVLGDDYTKVIVFSQDGSANPTWLSSGASATGEDQVFDDGKFSVSPGKFSGTFIDPDYNNSEISISFYYSDRYFEARASSCYMTDRICGICGNVNGNSSDDFEKRDGTILSNDGSDKWPIPTDVWDNTFEFGDSWCNKNFTSEIINDGINSQCAPTPVPTQPTIECLNETALLYCEIIYNDYCIDPCGNSTNTSLIDYTSWLEDCVFDTCIAGIDNDDVPATNSRNTDDDHDTGDVNSTLFGLAIGECNTFCELRATYTTFDTTTLSISTDDLGNSTDSITNSSDITDDDDEEDDYGSTVEELIDQVVDSMILQLIIGAGLLCCCLCVCFMCCKRAKKDETVSKADMKTAIEVLNKVNVQSQSPSQPATPGTPQSTDYKFA